MKRFGVIACSLVCLGAAHLPCVGQANPWNGTWKMDMSSVKYDGPTFTVMTDADGYSVKMGSDPATKTVCDGKPQAGPSTSPKGTMVTCTKMGSGVETDSSIDGRTTRKIMTMVSADGKTLTRKAEVFPKDESPYTMTFVSTRVSGGPGMAGVWKEMQVKESQESGLLTITVTGDSVAFKETDMPKPTVCKLDGTEVKTGDDSTMAVVLAGPKTLKVTYRSGGKVRRENTFELSADGKTVKETDVTPDPAPSTTSMVLRKV